MTKKANRITSIVLVLALIFSLFSITSYAEVNSSAYIYKTSASVLPGSSSGKIIVNYSITGMGMMDTIGAFSIKVYRSTGSLYCSIYGSTTNGLLINNACVHAGSYMVTCVPGASYYCEVTLIAAKSGGGDTRTIQTGTIVAPSSP